MSTLFTHDDFYRLYYKALGDKSLKTYRDAYEKAEEEYKKICKTNKNKYSSYAVFRATLSRDLSFKRL